jgi:hypothetical protein
MTSMAASKSPSRRASGDEETFGCGNGELKRLLLNGKIVEQTTKQSLRTSTAAGARDFGFSNSVAA